MCGREGGDRHESQSQGRGGDVTSASGGPGDKDSAQRPPRGHHQAPKSEAAVWGRGGRRSGGRDGAPGATAVGRVVRRIPHQVLRKRVTFLAHL